jgi:hypothetical protein
MTTLFDILTSKLVTDGDGCPSSYLSKILLASDFADRHGKVVFTSWLKSVISNGLFDRAECSSDLAQDIVTSSSCAFGNMMLLVKDIVCRGVIPSFCVDVLWVSLRECLPVGAECDSLEYSESGISLLCGILELLLLKSSKFDVSSRLHRLVSFALLRLSIAKIIFPLDCIKRTIMSICKFVAHDAKSPIDHHLGCGYASIIRALTEQRGAPCISTGSVDASFVPRLVLRFFRLEEVLGTRGHAGRRVVSLSKYRPSALDISLLLTVLFTDDNACHIPKIVKHISPEWTRFEYLLVSLAFWNVVIGTNQDRARIAIDWLLKELVIPNSLQLAQSVFRFIALQTTQLSTQGEFRIRINTLIQSRVDSMKSNRDVVRGEILGISRFYQIEELPDYRVQPVKRSLVSDAPGAECLDTLVRLLKSRRTDNGR